MMPDSINGKRIELINYKREKGIDGIKSTDGTDHIISCPWLKISKEPYGCQLTTKVYGGTKVKKNTLRHRGRSKRYQTILNL